MYENLIETLRFCAKNGDCHDCPYEKPCAGTMGDGLYCEAADAIEERDRYALTLQHEMMSEAESHIALVERMNKQIEELQKQVAHWQGELVKSMCGEWLAEDEKPRWIPVTERMPEKRRWVLCRCVADIIEVLRWENNEWYHDPMHVYYPSFVTHWQKLPGSPKEDKPDVQSEI